MEQIIRAQGHPNIRATHKSTWQLTKESELSTNGNCIIGVSASHSATDLSNELKDWLRDGNRVEIFLSIGEFECRILGEGHRELKLDNKVDMVFRRSQFISDRTVTINTSFVANDLPENIKIRLRNPDEQIIVKIKTIAN